MTPLQRTYAIAEQGQEAHQQIIAELREQMSHMIRLDDPVVTGLVEALNGYIDGPGPECYYYVAAEKALSAYEAQVKAIEPQLQNHGHLAIDHKYNNETTTMSPARVKEVEK